MSRHRRHKTSSRQDALWDEVYRAHRAGETTIEELCARSGYSKTTVYDRLREAADRAGDPDDFPAPMAASGPAPDRRGAPDLDDGTYCVVTDDIREVVRPQRNYTNDPIHGEEAYAMREHYLIASAPGQASDRCSLDATGGPILTTGRSGQRLKRSRLGTGEHVQDPGGPTKHAKDPNGLAGGTGKGESAPAKADSLKRYTVSGLTIWANTKSEAIAEAKRQLGIVRKNRGGKKVAGRLPKGTKVERG